MVIVSPNRARDVDDAMKRNCICDWLDHRSAARRVEKIRREVAA